MRRPRITDRVIAGLEVVAAHAQADRDVMEPSEHRDRLDAGIEYARQLARWHRAKKREALAKT